MDFKWWLDLKNDTRRLIAALVVAILALVGVVKYRSDEIKDYQVQITQLNKEKEVLIKEKSDAKVEAKQEVLEFVNKLYAEQKAVNHRNDSIKEQLRQDNQIQGAIIIENTKTAKRAAKALRQSIR